MICIFEDGRMIFDEGLLEQEDEGQYIAVEMLPEIPPIEGQVGYFVANLEIKAVEVRYMDAPPPMPEPEPTPIPEPPLSETEQAIFQTALNTEYMMTIMELSL